MRPSQISYKIFGVTCLFLVFIMGCLWLENHFLFQPYETKYPNNPIEAVKSPAIKNAIQEVYFKTHDGSRLNGWYVPAKGNNATIVYAHGNGGNLGDKWAILGPFIDKGYGFFAFDYRGYGQSAGSPSEQGVYQDMETACRFLAQRYGIPPSRQIAVGGSLGGAVVVDIATRVPFKAIVVFSSFTSIPDVLVYQLQRRGLGWLRIFPFSWLVWQDFDSLTKIKAVRVPILIGHGAKDRLVPVSMSKQLYQAAGSSQKRFFVDPEGGHGVSTHKLITEMEALLQ